MTTAGPPPTGWMCLKFTISQPMYYRYQYVKGGTAQLATNVTPPGGADWLVEARGDLDGDNTFSGFIGSGKIVNGQAVTSTEIATAEPDE